MCSPGVTLRPSYLAGLSGEDNFCRGDAGRLQVCTLLRLLHRERVRLRVKLRAAGCVWYLSPRLSNWNLSLQSERVQGLAGYCTQGTGCSSRGPFTFEPTALSSDRPVHTFKEAKSLLFFTSVTEK